MKILTIEKVKAMMLVNLNTGGRFADPGYADLNKLLDMVEHEKKIFIQELIDKGHPADKARFQADCNAVEFILKLVIEVYEPPTPVAQC